MKKMIYSLLVCCLLFPSVLYAQTGELPRSTPEAEGVPSHAMVQLFDSLMALPHTEIHSVMVLRHGKVIGEIYPAPIQPEYRHTMYSCSKTFVSAAVGLAVDDNRLRLTDRVAAFFPELLPDSVSANLASMTVRDLLTMSSGITPDWNLRNIRRDWIRGFLAKPVKTPGKQFEYDSLSTYMLSAIVQKVTGMTVLDYLKAKLFAPMHITEVAWELSPEGICTGGWGLHIQPESLAKFGQLLLDKGVWEGKQLLPSAWVEKMMGKQMENGAQGYGYQMWRCEHPGAARLDGAFGQYVLVIPDKDMVVVITECTMLDGKRQRRLVWNQLLPQVGDEPLQTGKDYKQLQKKMASCSLPLVAGKASSAQAKNYAGKVIALEDNKFGWKSLELQFVNKEVIVKVTEHDGKSYGLSSGYKAWETVFIDAFPPYSIGAIDKFKGIEGPFGVAASHAWTSPTDLQMKLHYVNWITSLNITFHFEGENILLTLSDNLSGNKFTMKGAVE